MRFADRILFIREQLLGFKGADGRKVFASKINTSHKTIERWESKKAENIPQGDVLKRILEAFPEKNININWLLTGQGEPFPGAREQFPEICGPEEPAIPPSEGTVTRESYILIPEVEGRVTAGPEGGLLYDEPVDHYPFKKTWVLRKFGRDQARHKALVLVRVTGDSMVPTINPGELVLVDAWEPERLQIKDGSIYLVRMPDGMITVKRLILNRQDGEVSLVCLSDNPSFKPFKFQVEMPLQWYVLGRIRWVGREID